MAFIDSLVLANNPKHCEALELSADCLAFEGQAADAGLRWKRMVEDSNCQEKSIENVRAKAENPEKFMQ